MPPLVSFADVFDSIFTFSDDISLRWRRRDRGKVADAGTKAATPLESGLSGGAHRVARHARVRPFTFTFGY